jgi:K+-sensing histidine kinase KdpD
MSLLSGIELLSVLVIIRILFLLGLRLRARTSNVILLFIIAVLLVALISLSKLTMALFRATLFLGALLVLFVLISFRHS